MLRKFFYIALIVLLTNSLQSKNRASSEGWDNPEEITAGFKRTDLIAFAKMQMGTTYQYAGIDPAKGFDCSGFVHFVFKNFNINLPRGSREYKYLGTALAPEDFKVGDILVFYGYRDNTKIGHVGIICEANGMKSKFIHSTSGKAYGVTISDLDSEIYTRRFYKCIDVIQE